MAGSININQNNNQVILLDQNRQLVITNNNANTLISVIQPITSIIEVKTLGPRGLTGPQGPSGSSGDIDTGSLVTTSSFNTFTSSIQSDINSLTNATSSYQLISSFNAYTGSSNSKFNGKLNVVANTVSSDYFVVFSNGSGTGTTIYSDPTDALRYNPGTGTLTSTILTLRDIITITPQHPLKVDVYNPGTFAVSASTPPKPYFWDGSNWNPLY